MPPLSPALTAMPSTRRRRDSLWTRYGGMRWSTSATGITPPASILASRASIPKTPYVRDWKIVAKVQSCDEQGNATLTLNNKFSVGGYSGAGRSRRTAPDLTVEGLWDEAGEALEQVCKPQMVFRMKLPQPVPPSVPAAPSGRG